MNRNHLSSASTSSSSSNSSPIVNVYDGMMPMPYPPTVTYYPSHDSDYNDKRSAHNALERQRREGLNNKFQELAHVLPSLRQVRRPSKSMIVAKSLEFVSNADERESTFQCQIQALRKENEQLMRQAQLSKKKLKKKKTVVKIEQEQPQVDLNKRSRESSLEIVESTSKAVTRSSKKRKQVEQPVVPRKKSSAAAKKLSNETMPVIKTSPSKSQPLITNKASDNIKMSPSSSQPLLKTTSQTTISQPVVRSSLHGQSNVKTSPNVQHSQTIVRTQHDHHAPLNQHDFELIQSYINSIPSQDNDILDSFIQNDEFFQWNH